MGHGEIDGADDLLVIDEKLDGVGKVSLVNPGNILAAVSGLFNSSAFSPYLESGFYELVNRSS